jgi:hypothetical protein
VDATGLRTHGTPVGRGRIGLGLPTTLIQAQHVVAHPNAAQPIGGPLRPFSALGHHQQISIRKAIPIAPGLGSEQPDPAGKRDQDLGQLVPQRL